MEDKLRLQSRATEKYYDQIFEGVGRKGIRRGSANSAEKEGFM